MWVRSTCMKVGNTVLVWIILYFTVTMYKKGGGGRNFIANTP